MNRQFFPLVHRPGGGSAQQIACGSCGATDEIIKTTSREMPPEAAANMFRHRGWHVGRTDRKHRCPECIRTAKKPKPEKENVELGLSKDSNAVEIKPPASINGASEEPPREMDREDRRIIFAKLDEVYLNERDGYASGWNDQRVAVDLNCPRKWVEIIRDENFGPQKSEQSAEIIDLKQRIDGLEDKANGLALEADAMRRNGDALVQAATVLHKDSETLLKAAETLRSDVRKLTGARDGRS